MKEHKSIFSISLMCKIFGVSSSGYYSWLNCKPSARKQANCELDAKVIEIYNCNRRRYGSPRITMALKQQGIVCSENRVARRMHDMKLCALAKSKYKVTTDSEHGKPIYENILNRDFTTTDINQKWAGDITYIATAEGWL